MKHFENFRNPHRESMDNENFRNTHSESMDKQALYYIVGGNEK